MKYLCDPQIIPAIVARSAGDIDSYASSAVTFALWLHVDISDGQFTPDKNWPLEGFDTLPKTDLSYEAHLMVTNPEKVGIAMISAGAHRLIAHKEAFESNDALRATCAAWKKAGAREVGIALLINTPLTELDPVIDVCDFVQLMSIDHVGHQGEQFDEHVLSRVEEFHAKYPDMMVAVDGGISEATVEQLVRAGANRLVVGHVLVESADPEVLYARIHERAMLGCKPQTLELSV